VNYFEELTKVEWVLVILAALTGLVQLALLASMALRGGTVTVWWGLLCAAFLIALVVIA